MRDRLDDDRGECGCEESDSEEDEEALDIEGDIVGRLGGSGESFSIIETGWGKVAVALDDDGEMDICWQSSDSRKPSLLLCVR